MVQNYEVPTKSPRVAEKCDVNVDSLRKTGNFGLHINWLYVMTIVHVQDLAYHHTSSLFIQSKDDIRSSWVIGGAYICVGASRTLKTSLFESGAAEDPPCRESPCTVNLSRLNVEESLQREIVRFSSHSGALSIELINCERVNSSLFVRKEATVPPEENDEGHSRNSNTVRLSKERLSIY
ncbi:hypothetical protein TNCV_4272451 [Trichonephila clavipes]|nr:hypothetical protein TNCV_4272451 [Trichonephila clavipes]